LKTIISGRHVGVTDAMKDYARTKVEKLTRYFGRATSTRVTMDVDHADHIVEMVMEVNRGVTLVGKAGAADMYAACDLAEQKLGAQLRKYKERLTDHHRGERRPEVDTSEPVAEEASGEREATYEDVIEDLRGGD
jgi:putative sigma-54 modulation protein